MATRSANVRVLSAQQHGILPYDLDLVTTIRDAYYDTRTFKRIPTLKPDPIAKKLITIREHNSRAADASSFAGPKLTNWDKQALSFLNQKQKFERHQQYNDKLYQSGSGGVDASPIGMLPWGYLPGNPSIKGGGEGPRGPDAPYSGPPRPGNGGNPVTNIINNYHNTVQRVNQKHFNEYKQEVINQSFTQDTINQTQVNQTLVDARSTTTNQQLNQTVNLQQVDARTTNQQLNQNLVQNDNRQNLNLQQIDARQNINLNAIDQRQFDQRQLEVTNNNLMVSSDPGSRAARIYPAFTPIDQAGSAFNNISSPTNLNAIEDVTNLPQIEYPNEGELVPYGESSRNRSRSKSTSGPNSLSPDRGRAKKNKRNRRKR